LFGKWRAVCAAFSFLFEQSVVSTFRCQTLKVFALRVQRQLEKHNTINLDSSPFAYFASPLMDQPRGLRSCSIPEHVLAFDPLSGNISCCFMLPERTFVAGSIDVVQPPTPYD